MSPYVSLTDDELIVMDGKCSDDVQKTVDQAKSRIKKKNELPEIDPKIAAFIADVITEAQKEGVLIDRYESINRCSICGRAGGYHKYARTSRHHRRGEPDHDRPITIGGVELAKRFIRWKGSVTLGCCTECWKIAKPLLSEQLKNIKAEIPESITGIKPQWKKYDLRKCKKCGWEGHEGQLGQLQAMMGGTYPGKCPQCGAESNLFNTAFDYPNGFALVETTP
jgi:hypothetical protein